MENQITKPRKTYIRLIRHTPILAVLFFVSCTAPPKIQTPNALSGSYFGLTPADTPAILAPQIISTQLTEYNGTFSPDGNEFYYTTEVAGKSIITFVEYDTVTKYWTTPKVASFSGQHSEYDPLFSPDGTQLYFSSERPTTNSSNINTNIWYVHRHNISWSEPLPILLTGNGDYYSSLTLHGDIYFNVWSTGKIMKAVKTDTGYVSEVLSHSINGSIDVGDPFISPDEDYLIFRGYYKEGFGRGDLYISYRINSAWTTPINLGAGINTSAHEICPFVTNDGKLFIFSSDRMSNQLSTKPDDDVHTLIAKHQTYDNGNMNIYYISAEFISEIKKRFIESKEQER